MSRIIRRFAAVLMITLTGYGITHAAVPAHQTATGGSGPVLTSSVVANG
jgi:hypothetical protein